MTKRILLLLILSVFVFKSNAQTTVPALITSNQVWTLSGSPYLVNQNSYIDSENIRGWVSELTKKGLNPLVDIIEEVTTLDELPLREKHWIDYYFNLNPLLLNIQSIPKEIEEIRSDKTDQDLDKLLSIIDIIPEILKRERMLRGVRQEELSKLTGMSRSTISLLENGSNINIGSIKLYLEAIITKNRVTTVKKERVRNTENDETKQTQKQE